MGRAIADGGTHEVAGTDEIERGSGIEIEPPARDAGRALEVDRLGFEAVTHQVPGPPAEIGVDGDVRHARIGPLIERQRAVDRLVLVGHGRDVPVQVAIGKHRTAGKEGSARALRSVREVLEILGVADVLAIQRQPQTVGQVGHVEELHVAAARMVYGIVRQIVPGELAVLVLREVTEVAADVRPAAAVLRRLESEIGVRGDVPVVGNRDLRAAGGAVAEHREEKAALADIAERKRHPGQVQDGHTLEVDARVAARAHLLLGVERDPSGAQHPGLVVHGTGREGDMLEAHQALRAELHFPGGAARRALHQAEGRRLDLRAGGRGVAAARAGDMRDRVGVVDAALGAHRVVVPVVLEMVRLDRAISLAHDHVPGQGYHAVDADHAVAGQADRASGRDRFLAGRRPAAAGPGAAAAGGVAGRRARLGSRRLVGAQEWGETAEQQQGGEEWAPTRHEGRHYNGPNA